MSRVKHVYVFKKGGSWELVSTTNDKVQITEAQECLPRVFDGLSEAVSYTPRIKTLEIKTLKKVFIVKISSSSDDKMQSEVLSDAIKKDFKHGRLVRSEESLQDMSTNYLMELNYVIDDENPISDVVKGLEDRVSETLRELSMCRELLDKEKERGLEYKKVNNVLSENYEKISYMLDNPTFTQVYIYFWSWLTNMFKNKIK